MGPSSPQSSSVSVVFLVSMAARHQHICFCGAGWRKSVCLLNSEGNGLTVKVSHKKRRLDTAHRLLSESDCMWVKSLVFREAHDSRHDEYHLLLGRIASFLFIFKSNVTRTHTPWLIRACLEHPTLFLIRPAPRSFSQQNLPTVIGSPGSVAPSYRRWEEEG